jgi:hypothetical protein
MKIGVKMLCLLINSRNDQPNVSVLDMCSNEKVRIEFVEKSNGSFFGFLHSSVGIIVQKEFSVVVADFHIFPHYPMTITTWSTQELYFHPERKQANWITGFPSKSGVSTSLAFALTFGLAAYNLSRFDNP